MAACALRAVWHDTFVAHLGVLLLEPWHMETTTREAIRRHHAAFRGLLETRPERLHAQCSFLDQMSSSVASTRKLQAG
jgi:hypothetical protein